MKRPDSPSPLVAACLLVFLALLTSASPASGGAPEAVDGSRYACWPLGEALDDLQQRSGLRLLWSSDLVRQDMQVTISPSQGSWLELLAELLAPFGLEIRRAEGSEIWLVVASDNRVASPPNEPAERQDLERLIPDWLDERSAPVIWSFPSEEGPESSGLQQGSRHLLVRVDPRRLPTVGPDAEAAGSDEGDSRWEQAAFELKQHLVQAASTAPGLRVGFEASPEILDRLLPHGLAPYVHAYVAEGRAEVPAADPSARLWSRHGVSEPHEVLPVLLSAASRGDQLVILEKQHIDDLHGAFLRQIQAVSAASLDVQPEVEGLDPGHAQFFIDPESGDHYLAVYAEPGGHQIRVGLSVPVEPSRLFPSAVEGSYDFSAGHLTLRIAGDAPYQLFLLESMAAEPHRALDVASSPLIDPYEQVVANQVFQRRQQEKFQSLDVMEYLELTPQYVGGDQITWEHRILQRKGKLTEYHHLGFRRNGVVYPEKKLLMGRLFRNEALVQLHPLEIELDETYRYEYLGEEVIEGRPTYHIRFQPLRTGSRKDGTFVRGEVWLDQETRAHLKVRTYQEGLDGRLVYQDRSYFYGWIHQGDTCFWDWRRREGSYVVSSLGNQFAVATETRREDFRYNRPDIDRVAQEAYDSDVMIHVETPPEGHRWLVKLDGERRLAQQPDEWQPYPRLGMDRTAPDTVPGEVEGVSAREEAAPVAGRVLADVGSYSGRASFTVGGFGSGSGQSVDLFPGLVLTDQDLFGRGYFGYVGIFKENAEASIGLPGLFGGRAVVTATADLPYEEEFNGDERLVDGEPVSLGVETYTPSLSLGVAMPLRQNVTLDLTYTYRALEFDRASDFDPDRFMMPVDTSEHILDAEVSWRWRKLHLALGLEAGHRSEWQRWGLDGGEEPHQDYRVFRVLGQSFHSLRREQTLGVQFSYFRGFDLDRFSRLPAGRSRATVVGFSTRTGFDEASFASVTYATSLWRKLPINLRLETGLSRLEDQDWQERVGASFRFLVNGPWRTDLWPSISYSLYSTVPGEEGEISYGLLVRRRY